MSTNLKASKKHYQKYLTRERKRRYDYFLSHRPDWQERRLKKVYGMTLQQYADLLKKQKGVCGICKKKCVSNKNLCVDHDHQTGEIRGLLCTKCNKGLGLLEEGKLLKEAIKYLEKHVNYQRN